MFPPAHSTTLDIQALSGIAGSISIACWVVVFSPQIIENFRRSSAEGLSITFIIIWLLGDVFNILGAILQGVLPTMIILAIYYTLADIVLLGQCFYYRGFTWRDEVKAPKSVGGDVVEGEDGGERRPLLRDENGRVVDGTHLSPATPLLHATDPPAIKNAKPTNTMQTIVFNTFSVLLVCAAGAFGWWISSGQHGRRHHHHHIEYEEQEPLEFDYWGQIFGYLCAVLYLGSRIPQLLLNYRRKSTEGVSLLFFLFACIGNLTYDMSIFAYSPICKRPGHCEDGEAARIYARYIAVNASWIAGSLGTLFLDLMIFAQFFMYKKTDEEVEPVETTHEQRSGGPS